MIPWFNIKFPSLGPLTIHAFGILVATGILVGSRLTRNRGRQLGIGDEMIASMITTVLICGFLFAHIFDVFAYQTAGEHPTLWQIINPLGGLSSYGGFIGALGGLFYWTRKYRQPVMPYADSLAYGLATGWMFGRLGCFTAHDHPGLRTDFFLGVQYPGGTRHDLGLYEAIWALAVTVLFQLLARRNRPLGLYVALLSLLYGPVRFALDFLRASDVPGADPRYFSLTPAQYGSVAVFVAGILLLMWTVRQARAEAAAA
jgi:phosphatidylglycerol:prolipoprotein diacylglycerol transferase